MSHRLPTCVLCHHLSCISCALAGSLEATLSATRPANRCAIQVGNRNDGIIKRSYDMRNTGVDVLAPFSLNDLDLLNNRIWVQRKVLFLFCLTGCCYCRILLLRSLLLRGLRHGVRSYYCYCSDRRLLNISVRGWGFGIRHNLVTCYFPAGFAASLARWTPTVLRGPLRVRAFVEVR